MHAPTSLRCARLNVESRACQAIGPPERVDSFAERTRRDPLRRAIVSTPPVPCFREVAIVWNIIIGLVMIVGGATGTLSLKGTGSSGALTALGVVLLIWGGVQMAKRGQA
jgi:hypothetical protein